MKKKAEINTERSFRRVELEIVFKNKSGRKSTYESSVFGHVKLQCTGVTINIEAAVANFLF